MNSQIKVIQIKTFLHSKCTLSSTRLLSHMLSCSKFFVSTISVGYVSLILVACDSKQQDKKNTDENKTEKQAVKEKPEIPDNQTNKVTIQEVIPSQLTNEQVFQGKVIPIRSEEVITPANGRVSKINIKQGQRVKKGEILYQIDQTPIKQAITKSKSELRYARASLKSAKMVHKKAQSALVTDQLELSQAKKDLSRYQDLIVDEAISEQALQQAESKVQTTKLSINTSKVFIQQTKADIKTIETNIMRINNVIKEHERSLENTLVKSPISGIIIENNVKKGSYLKVDQPKQGIHIASIDKVMVEIYPTTTQRQQIRQWAGVEKNSTQHSAKKGKNKKKIKLILKDGTVYKQSGKFAFKKTKVNKNNVIAMRILFDNKEHGLLPNMKVKIVTGSSEYTEVTLLPLKSVRYMPEKTLSYSSNIENISNHNKKSTKEDQGKTTKQLHYTYIVDQNNKLQRRFIEINGQENNQIIITKGLISGDKVVIDSEHPLIEKQKLTITGSVNSSSPVHK